MDEVHNYSFPTEFESLSGQLTQQKGTAKVVSPEDDSQHRRLKQAKMHMKAMSKVYHKEQSEKHRLQRSLDKVTRKSTQQRMDFLRMYSCKKNRCELKEMLEQKRKDDEWMTKQSAETTKRKKLENELHSILVKNQNEQNTAKLQSFNRRHKESLRSQIRAKQQELYELAKQKHEEMRATKTQFQIRKHNISSSVAMRSRNNYLSKIGQQLQMIQEYKLLMEEIRKYDEAAGLDLQADFTPDKEQPALFLTTPNHTN